MPHRRFAVVLALVLLLASTSATADPLPTTHVQTEEPRLLCVPPMPVTRCREIPPGRFVDEGTWGRLDAELRRSQDAETRLQAENRKLRDSVSGWSPGWRTLAAVFVVGVAGGAYAARKL